MNITDLISKLTDLMSIQVCTCDVFCTEKHAKWRLNVEDDIIKGREFLVQVLELE